MSAKRVNIVRVRLVRESSLLYEPRRLGTPQDAAALLREVLGSPDRESFVVLSVNAKHEPTAIEIASTGTLGAALVHPREIFKGAILANAHAVMFCHNHPSGDPEPSREDLEITRRLAEAGRLLGIEVLDHLVLGADDRFVSLRERGAIAGP